MSLRAKRGNLKPFSVILSAAKNLPFPSAHSELVEEGVAISMKRRHGHISVDFNGGGGMVGLLVLRLFHRGENPSTKPQVSAAKAISRTPSRPVYFQNEYPSSVSPNMLSIIPTDIAKEPRSSAFFPRGIGTSNSARAPTSIVTPMLAAVDNSADILIL
jgi:hypothetical protein